MRGETMNDRFSERRSSKRFPCSYNYISTSSTLGRKIACTLHNISVTGACIISDTPLQTDELITLHVCDEKDIPFRAKVVWQRFKTYGLLFLLESSEDFDNISYVMNNLNQKRNLKRNLS
jgi:hypothetical protein